MSVAAQEPAKAQLSVNTTPVGGAPPAEQAAPGRVSEVAEWRTRTSQTFALD